MTRITILCAVVFSLCWRSAAADVVTDWNDEVLDAIRATNTAPPVASRALAIVHTAIYDAVNGIRKTHQAYFVPATGPSDASIVAAAAAAAHRVMVTLYPGRQVEADLRYHDSLLLVLPGPQRTAGMQWGETVAAAILQWRSGDGSNGTSTYTPGTQPGQWRPTVSFGGVVRPALLPNWGNVAPFALASGADFRPPAPPALTSGQYASDVNVVKALGERFRSTRTPEQTQIAQFWAYGPGTATPPGHWNQIARTVALLHPCVLNCTSPLPNGIEENARMFALLNIALADAAIACWNTKYLYNFWRPITAIQEADTDGNPATALDPIWTPFLETPPFPEYTSGHSTFSGAAAAVLAQFFGADRIPFSIESDDLPGTQRSYDSFSQAAQESGISRVYGGIHFPSANARGLNAGASIGMWVAWNYLGSISGS